MFVPFCAMAQGVRATGIVRKYPAIVNPVFELLMRFNVNIVQMPCPELFFDSWCRRPCQKKKYDTVKNRSVCRQVGTGVVGMVEMCQKNGAQVCGILGIERSPSCAVSLLTAPPPNRIISGKGIFIEELQRLLRERKLEDRVPFVGIDAISVGKTLPAIRDLIGPPGRS